MSDIDPFPIPTQIVSSDEYLPAPQTAQQREVEARLKAKGGALAGRLGMSRRQFFRTASGMAASYLVMNEVYRAVVRRERGRGVDSRACPGARGDAEGPADLRRPYALPVGQSEPGLRRPVADRQPDVAARADEPARLEQGPGGPRRHGRRPQGRQLPEGDLPRQRHQGGVAQQCAVDGRRRLAAAAGAGVQDARQGERPGRLAAHAGALHDHAGPVGLARGRRSGDRGAQAGRLEGLYDR